MSIATLKRKSQAQYKNSSVGQAGFSLNGTRRNQGYVGQTSLSRSLPRTLAGGKTPRGYGGIKQMTAISNYYNDSINQDSNINPTFLQVPDSSSDTNQIISSQIIQDDGNTTLTQLAGGITTTTTTTILTSTLRSKYFGSYFNTPQIFTAGIDSLNDPTVVKGTVINAKGMLEEKFRYITNTNKLYYMSCSPTYENNIRTCGYNIVKPDNNQHSNNGSDYIISKAKKAISDSNKPCNKHIDKPCSTCAKSNPQLFNSRPYFNYTKPESSYLPTTQGDYLTKKKQSLCNISKIFQLKMKRAPFACGSRN